MEISRTRKLLAFVITALALLCIFYWAVNTGSLRVGFRALMRGLFVAYNENVATIYDLRFPRILIAMVGGAAVAVSGVMLQAVMKNPLADPGILGISSGASFVAVVITAFFPQLYFFIPGLAFCGGVFACILIYMLSWVGNDLSPLRLILVGIAINAMFMGMISAINSMTGGSYSSTASLATANISMKTWTDFRTLVIYAVPGLIIALILSKPCNLLGLDDKTVRSLGINVGRMRIGISAIAVLLVSISTAIMGPISFLGLIIPHIARLLVGGDHKVLIPYSAILGAFCLLLADTLGRALVPPYEISPGIIMSVVGGPFFIILLRRTGKTYGR